MKEGLNGDAYPNFWFRDSSHDCGFVPSSGLQIPLRMWEKLSPEKPSPRKSKPNKLNEMYPTIAFHFRRWRITALCKYNHSACHLMSPLELPSLPSFQSNIGGHCGNASCPYSISISKLAHCTGNGKEQENVTRTRQGYVHAAGEGKDLPSQPTNQPALNELRLASTRNHFS